MTTKEKAQQMIDEYITNGLTYKYMEEESAKKCALISVDEIILSIIQIHNGMTWSERKQTTERNTGYAYWSEVKKQIQKL